MNSDVSNALLHRRLRYQTRFLADWQPEDGPFFDVRSLADIAGVPQTTMLLQTSIQGTAAWQKMRAKRLIRGPVKDIVVTVDDFCAYLQHHNPKLTKDDVVAVARPAVGRTFMKRRNNRAHPLSLLRDWLRSTRPAEVADAAR